MSKAKLAGLAAVKFVLGFLLVGALLFLPAGTWDWWKAWLLMGVLFIPMLAVGVVLLLKAPGLLEKRIGAREKESGQKTVVALGGMMFLGGFLLAGLDHRFGWLPLPNWLSIGAAVVFLAGYLLYAEVMRENAYLSRTVEVQEGQKVIDTGLYGVVRHPMYLSTLLLFLSIPLILGSLISLAFFLPYPFILAKRIKGEEALLEKELEGYSAYKRRVKYKIIPFVW